MDRLDMVDADDPMLDWLLDSDPSIRWQVLRDLTNEPTAHIATERARVAREGWGARLLGLQTDDGQWGGGVYSPKWVSTTYTLCSCVIWGSTPMRGGSEPPSSSSGTAW